MKNIILASSLAFTAFSNVGLAQCSKSGGQPIRPVYRPAPPVQHQPIYHQPVHHQPVHHPNHDQYVYTPVRKAKCSISATPEYKPVVQPDPAPVSLPEVEAGQQVTVEGRFFGSRTGRIAVRIAGLELDADVVNWSSTQVTAVLPQLPLVEPVAASVVVLTISGNVADQLDVKLLPTSSRPAPTAPAAAQERPVVTAGQVITLEGSDLGVATGQIQITVGGMTLNSQVSGWSNTQVTATLPSVSFNEPVLATIQIMTASGQVADQIDVTFEPASQQVAARR